MNNLKTFLAEGKNTHLEHLEDDIINDGVRGGKNAVNFLSALADMLESGSKRKMNVTVKWDGAPAIFCGTNPENGKFFVGTKSIFNKTPRINYTFADVDANHGGGLADKLKASLQYFPALNIPGIWQGDLLYTREDLSIDDVGGESCVTFQPNTITYAVPLTNAMSRDIRRAKIGVVWHTTYSGKSMATLSASFGADGSRLKASRNVWSTDATFRDTSGNATMTKREVAQFARILNMAKGSLRQANTYLRKMSSSAEAESLPYILKIYLNSYVRGGEKIQNTKKVLGFLEKHIRDRMKKKLATVRSKPGKDKWLKHYTGVMKEYNKYRKDLYFVIATYITLQTAKTIIIRKLEKAESIGTFLRTSNGYKVTAPEGYVAIDRVGKATKLVDRLEFSRANFTAPKNWG